MKSGEQRAAWTDRVLSAEQGSVGEQIALLVDSYLQMNDEGRRAALASVVGMLNYKKDGEHVFERAPTLSFVGGGDQ